MSDTIATVVDPESRWPPCPSVMAPRGRHTWSAFSSDIKTLASGVEIYITSRTCYLCGKKVEGV
jgi:hypothetical protein